MQTQTNGPSRTAHTSAHIRVRGLLYLAGGSLGFVIFVLIWSRLKLPGNIDEFGLFLLPIFVVFALKGLLELVLGKSFHDLSEWWMALKGWQRGVLGIVVVLPGSLVALWGILQLIRLFGRFMR